MAGIYVNPFTDVGFKIIFGQEASKELLITLLNELLAGEHIVEDLCFLDKENYEQNVHNRGIIYDLYCLTSTGEYIIVEMQCRYHHHFLDRTLYYVCRAIGRQIHKSPKNFKYAFPKSSSTDSEVRDEAMEYVAEKQPYGSEYRLHTVYGIFLMNFKENGLPCKFRTDTIIADRSTGEQINPHFRQIYLQFPYFDKKLKECTTLYDKLIYTLKHMYTWDRMPAALKEQVFERLDKLATLANLSESDRIAYDKALDSFLVGLAAEATARENGRAEGLAEGRAEGLAEGRAEGLAEGRAEGLAEGRAEASAIIAKSLKEKGVDVEIIAITTGLSAEEIAAL